MLPLGHLLNSFKDILYLCYANDAQPYFSIQSNNFSSPSNMAVESKSKHSYTVILLYSYTVSFKCYETLTQKNCAIHFDVNSSMCEIHVDLL